ncbi:MAG: RHS repeat-associated core domain-containing protein, partial [bacterium]
LHYNWNRYYDPGIGRMVSPDPIGMAGGINLFVYVANTPVLYSDPSGLITYQCRKPIDPVGGKGKRSGPDIPGNPLYHQYSCVIDSAGNITCGGQDRTGSGAGSAGKASNDTYNSDRCEKVQDDNQCFEQCLKDEWLTKRPWYGIPFGTDCQEYDDDVNMSCRKKCGL